MEARLVLDDHMHGLFVGGCELLQKTGAGLFAHAGQKQAEGFIFAIDLKRTGKIPPLIACAVRGMGANAAHPPAAPLVADEPVTVLVNGPHPHRPASRQLQFPKPA